MASYRARVLSMRAAAGLLAASSTGEGLCALLERTGIARTPTQALEAGTREALGLEEFPDALIGAGPGMVRVLVLALPGRQRLRDATQRIAARLASRAPHVEWILAVRDTQAGAAAIAAWSSGERVRRLVAFAWEPATLTDSDAETVCALEGARSSDDSVAYARYLELLGRDSLSRRFYRALEAQVTLLEQDSRSPDARTLALLHVSRLLFLCFIEARGWLNGERAFLAGTYDRCMRDGGNFHQRVLLPLFFGTLNTPPSKRAAAARRFGSIPFLNGGLFTRTPVERLAGGWRVSDEAAGALFSNLFLRYRFVAREDSATWSEASIDPEMLGRAFECLMARGDRKAGGVFFTPHALVARTTDAALAEWCGSGNLRHLRSIRVLDPACGSGAFLVQALERIADERLRAGERGTVAAMRRDVLARSIFGVDRNPMAVWLCELRLWLSVVIEADEGDPMRLPPLPNLDRNIRVGDALSGDDFSGTTLPGSARLAALRARYVRASGRRKAAFGAALDVEERRRTLARLDDDIRRLVHARRELVSAMRGRDLFGQRTSLAPRAERRALRERLRACRAERRRVATGGALPFSFSVLFPDAHEAGGFDLCIGNPPWVRVHRVPQVMRARYRQCFEVARSASWRAGAARARAGTGFASQVDLSALFVERSARLLSPIGVLALLLPVKLWQSLAGGGVRDLLLSRMQPVRVEDLSSSRHAFDAAVYPSLLVARATPGSGRRITLAREDARGFREWSVPPASLTFDDSPGAPWLLLPPAARTAFLRLRDAGVPLAESHLGSPRLGVKTGCNAAFVVQVVDSGSRLATVQDSDGERGKVELALLRPALRGDAVCAWQRAPCDRWIVWTHDSRGPLASLPDHARAWLRRRYGELASRTDAARARRWWSLFRVDAAANHSPRVAWADIGTRPRALVLPAGDPAVPLNTCYVLPCVDDTDAWAVAALLNSRVVAAWLNALAESARGGYFRYMGWTVGQLPVPVDWSGRRGALAAIGRRMADGTAGEDQLDEAVAGAYRLCRAGLEDLTGACAR